MERLPTWNQRKNNMNMLPAIQTRSGKYINFVDYTDNVYDISDIAHALSNLCRFTGHCTEFYSVAQHCVHASYCVPIEFAFEALMHDRIEAYLGDIASPLKQLLPDYKNMEHGLEEDSAWTFMLPTKMSPEVRAADIKMLATEKRDLMVETPDTIWGIIQGVEPVETVIAPWSPEQAYINFMGRYNELWFPHMAQINKRTVYGQN